MAFLMAILILNLILTVIFIIVNLKGKNYSSLWYSIVFLMVPVFGLAIYFVPHFFFKIIHKRNLYDRRDLILFEGEEEYIMHPKVEEELNIVPFQEALAVSEVEEKRALLLGMLKKDISKHSKLIQNALDDEDSETSHYAAAATMEIYRKMRFKIQELEVKFLENVDNFETRRNLIDAIYEYIDSGVLSERDRIININKYVQIISDTLEKYKNQLICEDYIHQIDFLMELKRPHEAEQLAKDSKERFFNEMSFMKLLEIYFDVKNKIEFDRTLEELRKADIVLSSKGLETMRFWIARSM